MFPEKRYMKILLDSNILVYAYDKSSANHEQAKTIMDKAFRQEIEAYLSPQVLYEFFTVITNPKKASSPMNPNDAADLCLDLWESYEIEKICPTAVASIDVFKLSKERNLSGTRIFDCVLAVTAKENNIDIIYTENVKDFKNYTFIKTLNPFQKK